MSLLMFTALLSQQQNIKARFISLLWHHTKIFHLWFSTRWYGLFIATSTCVFPRQSFKKDLLKLMTTHCQLITTYYLKLSSTTTKHLFLSDTVLV